MGVGEISAPSGRTVRPHERPTRNLDVGGTPLEDDHAFVERGRASP
jgi:hypothetical protein